MLLKFQLYTFGRHEGGYVSKIRVFHLEDYKILRDGVRFFLIQDNEIELAGGTKVPHAIPTSSDLPGMEG